MTLATELQAGLAALGLELPAERQEKLLGFISVLTKWNRTYNLTAIRSETEMLTHHLLDSLAVLPAVSQKSALEIRRLADVGSGAGLPGIPLAIADPDMEIRSIEAVEKKAAFQRQAKIELSLKNFSIDNRRVEEVSAAGFDAVISRAFAELADFIRLAGHLLKPGGRLLAMKGVVPEDEIKRIPDGWAVRECIPLHIPGLDAQRHLLVIEKV